MRLPFILTFLVIFLVASVFTLEQNGHLKRRNLKAKLNDQSNEKFCANDENCSNKLEKRGFGSVIKLIAIATGTAIKVTLKVGSGALLVGSLALTIINSATEGCATYPDICKNKNKLKQLEEECTALASQLMTKYENISADYEALRDITLNNIYIDNILQGIAEEVNQVFNMSQEVDNILSANIENTDLLGKYTAEEIVSLLVPPVENRLANLEKMIKETSKSGYKEVGEYIAISLGITAVTSGFSKFYSVYKSDEIAKAGLSMFSKTKMTFGTLLSKTTLFFKNFGTNIKSMLGNTLTSLRAKVANPKGAVKSYVKGISAAHTFVNSMGAAAGAVMIYINNKQWKDVNKAVKDSLKNYKNYKRDLLKQVNLANNQTETVSDVKAEAIATFNNIVSTLASGINRTIYDETELFENLQTNILPDNIVSLVIGEQADNSDVISKQGNVLKIVNDAKFNLNDYDGWVTALNMIVSSTYNGISSDTPVFDILNSVSLGFKYQTDVVKQFQSLISLESLICVLTFLLPSADSYKTFPLSSIRSTCVEGNPSSLPNSYILEHKSLTINVVTKNNALAQIAAKTDTSGDKCDMGWNPPQCIGNVYDILTAIEQSFANDITLVSYTAPSLKEVVYKIAELLPSESEFAFINLNLFRDGQTMSDIDFENTLWDAEDLQYACILQAKRAARNECRLGK